MPSYQDVMLGMKKAMYDADPSFQVEWPNSTPDAYTFPYVEFSFSFSESFDETLGSTDEHINGFVNIDVVVEKDTSTEKLGEIIDFIRSVFPKGRRIYYGTPATITMVTSHPSPKRLVETTTHMKTPVIMTFRTE